MKLLQSRQQLRVPYGSRESIQGLQTRECSQATVAIAAERPIPHFQVLYFLRPVQCLIAM